MAIFTHIESTVIGWLENHHIETVCAVHRMLAGYQSTCWDCQVRLEAALLKQLDRSVSANH